MLQIALIIVAIGAAISLLGGLTAIALNAWWNKRQRSNRSVDSVEKDK